MEGACPSCAHVYIMLLENRPDGQLVSCGLLWSHSGQTGITAVGFIGGYGDQLDKNCAI